MNPKIIIALSLIFLGTTAYYLLFIKKPPAPSKITLTINGQKFTLEVARTIAQKSQGLSRRQQLSSDQGMIFVYSQAGTLPFWMKNTLIPLDIIWLDQQGIITDIVTAPPQPHTPDHQLTIYQNSRPAQFVIELNSGLAQSLNLNQGDKIKLPDNL